MWKVAAKISGGSQPSPKWGRVHCSRNATTSRPILYSVRFRQSQFLGASRVLCFCPWLPDHSGQPGRTDGEGTGIPASMNPSCQLRRHHLLRDHIVANQISDKREKSDDDKMPTFKPKGRSNPRILCSAKPMEWIRCLLAATNVRAWRLPMLLRGTACTSPREPPGQYRVPRSDQP